MARLQSLGLTHEDIRPKNIIVTREGEYKLNYDPARVSAYQQIIRGSTFPEHKYLLSPELLGALYEEVPEPKYDHLLADVFAVGIVLLAACTLNDVDDIYNWHTMTIESEILTTKLNWVRTIYSERLYKLIDRMTKLDIKKRPNFISLEELVGSPFSNHNTSMRRVSGRFEQGGDQSATPKRSRSGNRQITPNKSAGVLPLATDQESQGPTYGIVQKKSSRSNTPRGGSRIGLSPNSSSARHFPTKSETSPMNSHSAMSFQVHSPTSKQSGTGEFMPKSNAQKLKEYEKEILIDRKTGKSRKGVVVKYYSDGSRYEGEMKGKMREGRGIYYYRNGDIYAGSWLADKFHGQGAYLFANGERFEGELVEGLKCGYGVYYYSNLNRYEGLWRDDKKNGKGIFIFYNSNEKYEGDWEDGERHGLGTFTFTTGDKYIGNWVRGEKSGKGRIIYANGAQFDGEWRHNKPNGVGVMKYINGDTYDGQWENGVKSGEGTYYYADGSRYEGEWQNDEKQGVGTFTHSKGDSYKGKWEGGVKSGYGIYRYKDGSIYDGDWQNDTKNGRGVLKLRDGTVYDGTWVNGERNGVGCLTLPNGDVYEGDFAADKMHGYGVYQWQNGNRYEGEWANNVMHGHGKFTMKTGDTYEGIWDNQKLVSVKK